MRSIGSVEGGADTVLDAPMGVYRKLPEKYAKKKKQKAPVYFYTRAFLVGAGERREPRI